MKNTILLLVVLCLGYSGFSQTVTTSPAVFTAEDEVTLTIDVTGTDLEGYTDDVWIWAWISTGCSSDCNAPTNVNPASEAQTAALVTRDETDPNVYTFTMVPTAFYGKSPAEIQEIGMLLKGRDWSNGQTGNTLLAVQPLEFIPTENRNFPIKFTQDDIVTFNYDQSLASNTSMASLTELYVHIFYTVRKSDGSTMTDVPYTDWNNVGSSPELQARDRGNGWFTLSIVPSEMFELEEGDQLIRIGYIFRNADGSIQGPTGEAFVTILN